MQYIALRTLEGVCHCIMRFGPKAGCAELFIRTYNTLLITLMIFKTKIYLNYRHIKTQSVQSSTHSVSVIQTSELMLYREIIAVCSQIHTKHINTLCGQNVELYIYRPSPYRVVNTPSWLYKPAS